MVRPILQRCLRNASRSRKILRAMEGGGQGSRSFPPLAAAPGFFHGAADGDRRCSSSAAAPDHSSSTSSSRSNNREDDAVHDAFRIFDLPHQFGLDEQELRNKYRTAMKALHPDVQQQQQQPRSPATNNIQNNADSYTADHEASAVTRAYDTLKRPHERATHLLELLGHPLKEDEAKQQQTTSPLVGACFLMDVMLTREEIEEASADKNQAALQQLHKTNTARMQECYDHLDAAFGARDFDAARKWTAQLQYWNRIDERLREAMDGSFGMTE